MAVHILGNGESSKLFKQEEWDENDIFVGCNWANTDWKLTFTCFIDSKAGKKYKEGHHTNFPAIVTGKFIKAVDDPELINSQLNIIDKIEAIIWKRNNKAIRSANSAFSAFVYCVEKYDETDYHIWGIDTLWSDYLKSSTDSIMQYKVLREKPNVASEWRWYWMEAARRYRDKIKLNFHIPNNVILIDQDRLNKDNLINFIRHEMVQG